MFERIAKSHLSAFSSYISGTKQVIASNSEWSAASFLNNTKNYLVKTLLVKLLVCDSLVKLLYFQFACLENCVYKNIRLAIYLKLKNVFIWQLQWSAIYSKYKFCFLSQSSKCQSMVIKSLNVWRAINLRIKIVFWE